MVIRLSWAGNWENKYRVKNFGVSGHTMLQKGDCPYMKNDVYRWCKEFNPDVVVIKLGTNDSKPQNWKYKDEFMTDAQQMIDELKAFACPSGYLSGLSGKGDEFGF